MLNKPVSYRKLGGTFLAVLWVTASPLFADTQSNVVVRVMASNLTSGDNQRYESPGLNILQGLKPDVVCIQEFNVSNSFGINTTNAISNMVATTFGPNYVYYREFGYSIPNGVVSRYPFATNGFGTWIDSDTGVNDRGFAWAQIDLPGTNDLYVVSVHLKASNSASDISRRAAQAAELKAIIQTNFPPNAWIIVGGDMNLFSETEGAITTFKTFLSDSPVPVDPNGNPNTNRGRTERYDRVLPSFSLTNLLTPVILPSHTFSNGLVFVSTNYVPLSDVIPVQFADSTALNMQHMGVIKDFKITFTVTNGFTVPAPYLVMASTKVIRWQGVSNVTYSVQALTNLATTNWLTVGTATSTTTNFSYTNATPGAVQRYFRVTYP